MISGRNGTRSAVVIGAGIGGLTAAVALHRIGWDVTVLERAPVITEVGAGLTLWPNAVRTLGVLGLEAAVSAHAIPTVSRGNIRQPDGRRLRHGRPDDVGVLATAHSCMRCSAVHFPNARCAPAPKSSGSPTTSTGQRRHTSRRASITS